MDRKERWGTALRLAAFDLTAVAVAVTGALRLKFGFVREIPAFYLQNQGRYILTSYLILMGMELFFGCGSYLPAFSVPDAVRLLGAVAASAAVLYVADRAMAMGIPTEVVLIQAVLLLVLLLGIRLSVRLWRVYGPRRKEPERVVIYGAGEAGHFLCERLASRQEESLRVVGFVDDNPALTGTRVREVRVLGTSEELTGILRAVRADQLILAMEHVSRPRILSALASCREAGCRARRFGTLSELEENRLDTAGIGEIRLEDLLHRESVKLDHELLHRFLEGRRVMVTGGAGSIGSELCRQVLRLGAGLLVVYDIHENGMYALDNELREEYAPERYRLCVGSVRDRNRLDQVMEQFRPELVFHAAAHKHVPMMEANPTEAVKNNVLGTALAARSALEHGAERFILVSTDKAVNPANIMGATKRIAELVLQAMDGRGGTRFAAVRFGNVLGSVGSVVPHFQEQIERGGPVTVTHPKMCRYFMIIPEAVQLVLEAGALAQGGEIFVLDMGEPVKILDLAKDMIRLSGLEPGTDIPIRFTGVRPGEKLFEELRLQEENTIKTQNDKIYVNQPVFIDRKELRQALPELLRAAERDDREALYRAVRRLVPTFGEMDASGGNRP